MHWIIELLKAIAVTLSCLSVVLTVFKVCAYREKINKTSLAIDIIFIISLLLI